MGKSFWVFSGPTPTDMTVYPERQRYGIRGINAHSPERMLTGSTLYQNPNATSIGMPLSHFIEPVLVPDDSKYAIFRVHKQVLKDFEKVGLAPLYLKRDFVSAIAGADVFHHYQETLIDGLPQYSAQTTYFRHDEADWLLYLEPVVKNERKRLELRSGMEGLTNAINEVLRHPGAHNEHLLTLAEMSFLSAPTPFKADKEQIDAYREVLYHLCEAAWQATGQWYPWFLTYDSTKPTSNALRKAADAFHSKLPARMEKLVFGQEDYGSAIFKADMSMESRHGHI